MKNKILCKVDNLTKKYDDKVFALNGINLDIYENEIFALIGPNGAGKTTFIKILMDIVHPTEGHIKMYNYSQNDFNFRKSIGYVPEEINLPYFKNSQVFLRYISILKDIESTTRSKIISDFLHEFDLEDQKKSTKLFSKGMKRKLSIVQALLANPKFLILDEATDGLDHTQRKMLMDRLFDFKEKGGTVLLSSHILSEIQKIYDRFGFILKGELIYYSSRNELENDTYFIETSSKINSKIKEVIPNCIIINNDKISSLIIPGTNLVKLLEEKLDTFGVRILKKIRKSITIEELYQYAYSYEKK